MKFEYFEEKKSLVFSCLSVQDMFVVISLRLLTVDLDWPGVGQLVVSHIVCSYPVVSFFIIQLALPSENCDPFNTPLFESATQKFR
jgi:hypothetical protein